MGWQEDKAAYQRDADAKLSGVSPAKKAAFSKITKKMQSGQKLTAQENYDYTHKFPEFFDKPMFDKGNAGSTRTFGANDNDRGSDPMRQGPSGLPNFKPGSRNPFAGGTPVPTGRGTGGGGTFGQPRPATGGGGTFGGIANPADYWKTHSSPGMTSNPASYWANHQAPGMGFPTGTSDRDRGSDPMRQPMPAGINDNDRGSDPMRRFPSGHEPDSFPGGQSPPFDGGTGGLITQLPDEQMPNIPKVTLAWHDFTNEAKKKVAGAYAPLYEAINQGKANATTQEKHSDAVIKGMYDALEAHNVADKAGTTKEFDNTISATKARNTAAAGNIKTSNQAANADLAQLMADSGMDGRQGTAAADILSGQVGTDSAAATQANTQANADLTNVEAQKSNQLSYETNTAAADRQAGTATRGELVNQLAGVLKDYDQQNLQTQGAEAQQGLQLNQQMGQNDFTAQQGSNAETWNNYNAAMGQYSNKVAQDQANVGLANNATMAQIEAAQKQAALTQDQNQFDLTYGQTEEKNAADAARAQAAQAAKDELDAKKLGISVEQLHINQQNADANTAGAANRTQGTNPNAPGYDPLKDPTSPQYNAAHNPIAIYRNSLLGFLGSQQRADSMQSLVDNVFGGMKPGTNGVSQIDFTNELIKQAGPLGFSPNEAAMAAREYQRSQGNSPTVIPAARY